VNPEGIEEGDKADEGNSDTFGSKTGLISVKYESLNTLQGGDPIASLSNLLKETVAESCDCNTYILDLSFARYLVTLALVYIRRVELKEILSASNYHGWKYCHQCGHAPSVLIM